MLTQHKHLFDEGTTLCLSDFLKGYVRSGEQLVKKHYMIIELVTNNRRKQYAAIHTCKTIRERYWGLHRNHIPNDK